MSGVEDEYWMRRALDCARHGLGLTSPNPPVGAILVKNGKEVSSGFHRGAGHPHAEMEAFHASRKSSLCEDVQGATLYVTLEPCSTRGRTGACTEAIKREKIARVVYGATDPNPAHLGGAKKILIEAGIEVMDGVLKADCEQLIRAFRKVQTTGLPWVIAKTAMSLDGRITRPPNEGQWLSGEASRADVQNVRAEADAILTSGMTVRDDDPSLTLRGLQLPDNKAQPWRVILTSRQDGVPGDSKVMSDEFKDRTLIFQGRLLEGVFRELVTENGVTTVLIEAGGRLLGRMFDEGWVDELIVYLAPIMTGGDKGALSGEGVATLAERLGLGQCQIERIDDDVRLRGLVENSSVELER